MRPLLLAAFLAATTALPAVAEDESPKPASDEASVPPLLVRWPLSPRPRAQAPQAEKPAEPAPQPAPAAAPPRPAPVREPEPLPERRPVAEPPEPELPVEPLPGRGWERRDDIPLEPLMGRGFESRPRPGFEPTSPVSPLEPGLDAPDVQVVSQKEPRSGTPGGTDRDTDLDVPTFFVPPARLALTLSSFKVKPPDEALRRWSFPEEEGLSWTSLESRREGDWVILEGAVDIRAGSDRIQADLVRLNERTNTLEAEGNVVLDHLESRLAGERMEYDLETHTGTVWNAIGFAPNDITFTGERVEKVGEAKYVVHSGSFTSCTQPLPIWQVKVSKAIVHVDNFVYLFNPRVLFKRMPASWLPWAAIPIKQERSTGFMVPKISHSSTRGLSVGEQFFWAINRSTDLTVGGQWWADFGWSTHAVGRWHLNGMSRPGQFEAIYVQANEPEEVGGRVLDDSRWYASVEHAQDLWENWKLTVKGELGSDRLTQQQPFFDLEGNLGTPTPVFNQRVTMQRRWGKHSLSINLENDERENEQSTGGGANDVFDSGSLRTTTDTTQRLPEVEYRLSSIQLGGKTWAAFQMEAAAGLIKAHKPVDFEGLASGVPLAVSGDEYDHDWFVVDAYPKMSFPISNPYFEIVPSFNLRATWWSKQQAESAMNQIVYDPDNDPMSAPNVTVSNTETIDDSLFLWAWDAGVRVGGPDFQRIYRRAAQPGQKKWQHLIEPEVDFRYTPTIDEEFPIARDRRYNHYRGRFDKTGATASVSLINTLRNKTVVPVGQQAEPARDWLIWRLSADYNFREKSSTGTFDDGMGGSRTEESHWGDIRSDINFRPTENVRFSLRNTYDVLLDDLVSTSVTGGVEGKWGYVDLAHTHTRSENGRNGRNELTLTGEHWFYKNDRIRLGYDFTKDFHGSERDASGNRTRSSWPYKRFVASYYNQCCGVSLSWEDVDDRSVEREKEWTLIISLKDVGNFLRLRQRSQSQR